VTFYPQPMLKPCKCDYKTVGDKIPTTPISSLPNERGH